jgi:hypothetical protein
MRHRTVRTRLIATILGVCVVTIGITLASEHWVDVRQPQPVVYPAAAVVIGTDAAGVEAAVQKALRVHQELQRSPAVQPGFAPYFAAFDRKVSDGNVAIQDAFTADAARKEGTGLNQAVKTEKAAQDHFRAVDSGVGQAKFDIIDSSTIPAVAEGTVETWSKMQFKNPDGSWFNSEPHNTIHFRMTLVKDSAGKWLVQSFDWDFPAGSGP